ncbi:MAG: ABC transporter permease [Bacteroidetes bacterium]|nr:ABC transporter permease [Bacteroidota bacterium]
MKTIRYLLVKEFKQIFRNRSILAMIVVLPVMQLIVMPLAADYEVKQVNLIILDHDRSQMATELRHSAISSGYFTLVDFGNNYKSAMQMLDKDKADLILEIPSGFEKQLYKENFAQVLISVNAINGVKANLGSAYLNAIIAKFNEQIKIEFAGSHQAIQMPKLDLVANNRFNVYMNYRWFMVPGILAILVTMIGGFLSALNIVKEKEIGTIEQINVTPINRSHFILGKLLPFWILGLIVFSIGMLVSYLVYGIVPSGQLIVLYVYVAIYLLAVLGLGLLVSTYSDTQQQAMFIMFFFMMVFILMGGLFTPIESMPEWAIVMSKFNPMTYFIQVMRMVILKGSSFVHIQSHMLITAIFAVVLNFWAVLNYSKRN